MRLPFSSCRTTALRMRLGPCVPPFAFGPWQNPHDCANCARPRSIAPSGGAWGRFAGGPCAHTPSAVRSISRLLFVIHLIIACGRSRRSRIGGCCTLETESEVLPRQGASHSGLGELL